MACTISISDQPNNSLGMCWLCKFEDDFTGQLYDKCLYPKSDFSAMEALNSFIAEHVRDDEVDVAEIYLLDSSKDDPEASAFAMTYKARFGIEYRSMHTAIHHVLVFENEEIALMYRDMVEDASEEDWEDVTSDVLSGAESDQEIDFRNDVEDLVLPTGEFWRRYEDGEYGVLLVNDLAYDFYV